MNIDEPGGSLEEVDEEIKRLTEKISILQKEAEIFPMPLSPLSGQEKQIKPLKFTNLPDLNNVEIPKGFERAPITCPFDPEKPKRLAALEQDLSEALWLKNRQDVMALVNKIRSSSSFSSDLNAKIDDHSSSIGEQAKRKDELREYFESHLVPSCTFFLDLETSN